MDELNDFELEYLDEYCQDENSKIQFFIRRSENLAFLQKLAAEFGVNAENDDLNK